MEPARPLPSEYRFNIAAAAILSIVTLGFYNIYWNARQFQAMNLLLGREKYSFWRWLILSLLTLGIFHVYYEFKKAADLYGYLKGKGIEANSALLVICLVTSFLGLTFVTDGICQYEINQLIA